MKHMKKLAAVLFGAMLLSAVALSGCGATAPEPTPSSSAPVMMGASTYGGSSAGGETGDSADDTSDHDDSGAAYGGFGTADDDTSGSETSPYGPAANDELGGSGQMDGTTWKPVAVMSGKNSVSTNTAALMNAQVRFEHGNLKVIASGNEETVPYDYYDGIVTAYSSMGSASLNVMGNTMYSIADSTDAVVFNLIEGSAPQVDIPSSLEYSTWHGVCVTDQYPDGLDTNIGQLVCEFRDGKAQITFNGQTVSTGTYSYNNGKAIVQGDPSIVSGTIECKVAGSTMVAIVPGVNGVMTVFLQN